MKFLCLGYHDVEKFDAVPEGERKQIMDKCYAMCVPFRAAGKVLFEEELQHADTAKTIKTRGGKQIFTDGPFAETHEQVGGFFMIEAENMEEALKVAALHPGALCGEDWSFAIEVRPVKEW